MATGAEHYKSVAAETCGGDGGKSGEPRRACLFPRVACEFSGRNRPPDGFASRKTGRGERIRTSGPCLPKTVLYQAELLPDRSPLEATQGRGREPRPRLARWGMPRA